jgi:hypothetical protein
MAKTKRNKGGRPETHPVKKIIGFTHEQLAIVEEWRARQRPIPNVSEAIRQLMERGLERAERRELTERSSSKSEPRPAP